MRGSECRRRRHQEHRATPTGHPVLQGEHQPDPDNCRSRVDEGPPQREAPEFQRREVVVQTNTEHAYAQILDEQIHHEHCCEHLVDRRTLADKSRRDVHRATPEQGITHQKECRLRDAHPDIDHPRVVMGVPHLAQGVDRRFQTHGDQPTDEHHQWQYVTLAHHVDQAPDHGDRERRADDHGVRPRRTRCRHPLGTTTQRHHRHRRRATHVHSDHLFCQSVSICVQRNGLPCVLSPASR